MGKLTDKNILITGGKTAGLGWPQRRNSTERVRVSPSAA